MAKSFHPVVQPMQKQDDIKPSGIDNQSITNELLLLLDILEAKAEDLFISTTSAIPIKALALAK